jgi:hypothetical protein
MGMSFFSSCPFTRGLSVPRKSGPFDKLMVLSKVEGHTRNADLTIVYHGGRCHDLSGPAGALRIGHETKKDMPMLNPLDLCIFAGLVRLWRINV